MIALVLVLSMGAAAPASASVDSVAADTADSAATDGSDDGAAGDAESSTPSAGADEADEQPSAAAAPADAPAKDDPLGSIEAEDDTGGAPSELESADDDGGSDKLGPFSATGMQVALGWLFSSLAGTLLPVTNVVPLFGQLLSIAAYPCGGLGALSGLVVTLVGDNTSQNRGSLFWPMALGACGQGGCTSAGLVAAPLVIVVMGGGSLVGATQLPPEVADGFRTATAIGGVYGAYVAAFGVLAVSMVGGLAVGPAAATAGYWLTSEEKQPGDDGSFQFPGWFEPNHPRVLSVEREQPPSSLNVASAMSY